MIFDPLKAPSTALFVILILVPIPKVVEWNNQPTLSLASYFTEVVNGKVGYISMPPRSCVEVKISIKKTKEIDIIAIAQAEVSGYRISGDGRQNNYKLDSIKKLMEERAEEGLDIVKQSESKKVIAKIDSKLQISGYKMEVISKIQDSCGKPIDQQNYVVLYERKQGFFPINKKVDDGAIDIGGAGKWCNIHALRVGDFNGDGKSDLLCNLMDGTNRIMLSDGSKFIKPTGSLDDNGTVKIAGLDKWCALGEEEGYLYLQDVNKDGKIDLLCHYEAELKIALSTGDGFRLVGDSDTGLINTKFCYVDSVLLLGSFNPKAEESSKSDLLCQSNTFGITIALSNQSKQSEFSGFDDYNGGNPVGLGKSLEWCKEEGSRLFAGDFNGDGKSDLLCNSKNGHNYLMFYKKASDIKSNDMYLFTPAGSPDGRDPNGYISISEDNYWCAGDNYITVADFDGDGKDDLYCNEGGKNMIMKAASTVDDVFRNYISFESISLQSKDGEINIKNQNVWCEPENILTGDFDGNGYADLLCNGENGISI